MLKIKIYINKIDYQHKKYKLNYIIYNNMDDDEIRKRLESYQAAYTKNDTLQSETSSSTESETDDIPEEFIHVDELLSSLNTAVNDDKVDFCVSYNNDDDFHIISKTEAFIGANCIYQIRMEVSLPRLRKKGKLNFFTLDKETDDEKEMFEIQAKEKLLVIKFPEELKYNLREFKLREREIMCVFNYMNNF